MDNLTHSLFGALMGQMGLKKKTGLAMPALIIGANLPDVDATCFFWLDGVEHLGFRRGITHGPIAMVVLPAILAWILLTFDRWQIRRGTRPKKRLPVTFKWLYLLSLIGCLSHPALDWLNVYGVRLLEPFSSQWFYGDTLFIIDVWLWMLLGFGVWHSLNHEKEKLAWERTGRIWMYLSLIYIGFNGVISTSTAYGGSADRKPDEVISSPVVFRFWEREVMWREGRVWWFAQHDFFNNTRESKFAVRSLCSRSAIDRAAQATSEGRAYMFWSRAPVAERSADGTIVVRDARFYDPRARGNFEVSIPELQCVDLGEEPRGQ
ncbi:metal-dependent hydrolase [Altererythrobacter lutimaris]|uniref:Metal-dependent hydrolase n=1 Tax=Altererythrobacter lutimaris TaxID=2743979 RepID=A0A850HGJ8_9SPHN|nr:metal-dependent hydrolase [Altererythrobacter lutimaris]NVE93892.1 metal-dependent hydrolase [Altererythrobacter lutimaris]